MALLQNITLSSWAEDFQFVLILSGRGEAEAVQKAHLEDYLEKRYERSLLVRAFLTLKYSYNWIVRHWSYLKEIGLVQEIEGKTAVVNCLIMALQEISFALPLKFLPKLPDTNSQKMVRLAQRYIDAERSNKPTTNE